MTRKEELEQRRCGNLSKTKYKMKKLFIDMDGTLVDFQSGIDRLDDETKREYEGHLDDVPGIFSKMTPTMGAVEAVAELSKQYDCHILSTAPWNNPGAWADKISWVKKYFPNVFHKKVTLTHHKEFLNDGNSFLIDDRDKHGAESFGKHWIQFGSAEFPDWESVVKALMDKEEQKREYEKFIENEGKY